MFSQANKSNELSMNLPVNSHIDRLGQLIQQLRQQTNQAEKDLHVLRGCITQLSFINKQSDRDLNQFLVDAIASMRNKWESSWEQQKLQLLEHKKKVMKIMEEQQDISIKRQQLQQKVGIVEYMVGLQ